MDKNSEFPEAEELLELNEYDSAIDLYKSTSMSHEPNRTHLFNLSVAEEQANLQFHNNLCDLYPDSFDCQSKYIGILIKYCPGIAVNYITKIISKWKVEKDIIKFRTSRLMAALQSNNPQTHVEDFAAILQYCSKTKATKRVIYGILKNITSINNLQSLDAIYDLAKSPSITDEVSVLLELKAKELECLIDFENAKWR